MRIKSRTQRRNRQDAISPRNEETNLRTRKGKSILKKGSSIPRKGSRLSIYEFIDQHQEEFGLRWLLNQFSLCPNAYYNYTKNRNQEYKETKANTLKIMKAIYHEKGGTTGYLMCCDLIEEILYFDCR